MKAILHAATWMIYSVNQQEDNIIIMKYCKVFLNCYESKLTPLKKSITSNSLAEFCDSSFTEE